jgi:hypothetical protein
VSRFWSTKVFFEAKKPITPYGLFEIFFTAEDVISKNTEITPDISNFNLHEITLSRMAADCFTAKTQSSQRFLFFPFGRDTQKEKPTGPAGGWLGFILNV